MIDFTGVKAITIPEGKVKQIVRKSDGAVLWKSFTNQIPISINSSGGLFSSTGYKSGYRLNSSGAETAKDGMGVTGYIPVKKGDTIYTKNMKIVTVSGQTSVDHCYLAIYNASFTNKTSLKFANLVNSTTHRYLIDNITTDGSGYVTSFTIVDKYDNLSAAYMRISAYQLDGNAIITVNEPID